MYNLDIARLCKIFVMTVFYERITELCKEKNIKVTPLVIQLGISPGAISRWKNGSTPKGEILNKFADYFNVSTDYLLGKTEKRQAPEGLTAKDLDTLARIKYLQEHSPEDYALVKSLIEKLANKQ